MGRRLRILIWRLSCHLRRLWWAVRHFVTGFGVWLFIIVIAFGHVICCVTAYLLLTR